MMLDEDIDDQWPSVLWSTKASDSDLTRHFDEQVAMLAAVQAAAAHAALTPAPPPSAPQYPVIS